MFDLAARRGDLQPDGMSRFESGRRNTFTRLPTGRPLVMRSQIRRRVQTQTGNDRVRVTVARVNRDPFAAATFTVIAKFRRTDRRSEQTGGTQRVGNCSRTIIAAIGERFVASAKNVGFAKQLIGRPDRAFHGERG